MTEAMLVCTVKNEGPFLLEWVAHHRLCGFDEILIYQNDSSDFGVRTLRTLERIGAIRFFENGFPPGRKNPPWQNRAYRRASEHEAFGRARWCIALDADEFLHVKCGQGRIGDLTAACGGDADEIRLNWRVFGSSAEARLTDELVTARFTQTDAAEVIARTPVAFKTLFRTDAFARPGIHKPKAAQRALRGVVNGSGLGEGAFKDIGFRSTDPGLRALAQINHYQLRDAESFLMKATRGSASNMDRAVGLGYWGVFERSGTTDDGLAARADALRAEMARLDALSNGRLMHLRARSLRTWRERIASLRAGGTSAELYEDIRRTQRGELPLETRRRR